MGQIPRSIERISTVVYMAYVDIVVRHISIRLFNGTCMNQLLIENTILRHIRHSMQGLNE